MLKPTWRAQQPSLLIDASIYIFQYYLRMLDNWFSKKGAWPTAAVYGYTCFLIRLLKEQKPERIAACFDEGLNSCFRHQIYVNYKNSRSLPDAALAFQLKACKKITELLGIKTFASKRFEADDLLGSLYHQLCRSTKPIALLSRDKDLCRLIMRAQDYLWDYPAKADSRAIGRDKKNDVNSWVAHNKGIKYFSQDIVNKFGVQPHQMSDFLALVGDVGDDIPGVTGVGKVTAQKLLKNFTTVERLLKNVGEISALSMRGSSVLIEKLIDYEAQIKLANILATIVVDIPLIQSVNDLALQRPDTKRYRIFCLERVSLA